ncbi:MAG TPA: hypothetical protein VH277_13930 [Gemmatimonadaceae bacterium]|jgi:hypothetical protein|nr:hypothetical protein [Gemmatimonadaceae bacterium]
MRPDDQEETLHRVLATQARSHGPAELWMTAVGGGMNAILLWAQFPALHWLASGFAAVTAYGAWGLLDRATSMLRMKRAHREDEVTFLRTLSVLVGIAGWAAALFAVVSLLTLLEGGLSIPGR